LLLFFVIRNESSTDDTRSDKYHPNLLAAVKIFCQLCEENTPNRVQPIVFVNGSESGPKPVELVSAEIDFGTIVYGKLKLTHQRASASTLDERATAALVLEKIYHAICQQTSD